MVDPNITSLFNDIYDSTNRKVFAFLAARCKSIPDAHDLFQDTYTELYAVLKRRGADSVSYTHLFPVLKIRLLLSCIQPPLQNSIKQKKRHFNL